MDALRESEQYIDFDESLLLKTHPRLGAAEDFNLSSEQVMKIFDINDSNFTPIPTRLVVPILKGRRNEHHSIRTHGWLYILEPQKWVPVVRHGNSVTASEFKTPSSKARRDILETKFNSDCKATVSFQGGGSYYGISAGVKQNSDITFEYSSTSMTEEDLRMTGVAGDQLVQELVLYPILRCKAIRKQRIDYTVNELTQELEWGTNSPRSESWERICVRSPRLARFEKMQLHPVPVNGGEREDNARLLPVPRIDSNGDFQVTTLLSHADWPDWYIYDAEFQDCAETIDLAASENDVAFCPTSCWTTELDDHDGKRSDTEPPSPETSANSPSSSVVGITAESQGHEGKDLLVAECALEPLDH
ncbi:hypothetical protein VMCG_01833 [Cytospora schulzeri]|uniref:Uncharacterized protein n=1 Tax=Cytospora schulzeri TaxID=448051 RepID=A0A423X389_9PEZI|nr:hypothetical protein VMCG_01833 [Valsa malicola]